MLLNIVVLNDVLYFLQLWDIRQKNATQTLNNTYQVTTVTFNDTSDQLFSGGIDNEIKVCHHCFPSTIVSSSSSSFTLITLLILILLFFFFSLFLSSINQAWDLRQNSVAYSMKGHGDTITGLSLNYNGYYLLSNSMDNTGMILVYMSIVYASYNMCISRSVNIGHLCMCGVFVKYFM